MLYICLDKEHKEVIHLKTKIAVLGSCISRDLFNSNFVPNYKDFFDLVFDAQRTTMISLMQDSVVIDNNLLDILPHNPKNNARTKFITEDLNKVFLKNLVEKDIDYLIIDNYFEFLMGILYFDNNTIITNNVWDLPETEFYKNMSDKVNLRIYENFEEYFCIWSKYCDLFFKFLTLYCPDIKVILIEARENNQVMKSDGTSYINPNFTKTMNVANPLLEKLDGYIINNFNVDVLKFDYGNTYCDENNVWGFAPMHFTKNFHNYLFNKLINIVSQDISIQKFSNNPKNRIFDEDSLKSELKRANFETQILLKNIKKSKVADLLIKYNSARIDVKNYGSLDNKIKLVDENFHLARIYFPEWFKSDEGEGMIIESEKNSINFRFECINDGILKIFLRGPDIYDKNQVRFPVYIDFTNLTINDELIFDENKLVWHDCPYIFEKEVKNSEIIDIHVEWLPFNKYSILE